MIIILLYFNSAWRPMFLQCDRRFSPGFPPPFLSRMDSIQKFALPVYNWRWLLYIVLVRNYCPYPYIKGIERKRKMSRIKTCWSSPVFFSNGGAGLPGLADRINWSCLLWSCRQLSAMLKPAGPLSCRLHIPAQSKTGLAYNEEQTRFLFISWQEIYLSKVIFLVRL